MLEARIIFGCCVLVGLAGALLVLVGAGLFSRRPSGARIYRPVVMVMGLLLLVPAAYWALLASDALYPPDPFLGPWQEVTTKDGVLSALIPGTAKSRADHEGDGRSFSEELMFLDAGDVYILDCMESAHSGEHAAGELLGNRRKELLVMAGRYGVPMVAGEKTLEEGGYSGRQWEIDAGDQVIQVRAYVVRGRVYQAMAIVEGGSRARMFAQRFLESVRIAKGG